MKLEETIKTDLTDAIKTQNAVKRSTLRLLQAAVVNTRIERGRELRDEEILEIIGREAKKRREAIEQYTRAQRDDLVESEKAELAVLEAYLPQQLSASEIADLARTILSQTGASSPSDLGKVMGPLMAKLKGRADGKVVNRVVRDLLSETAGGPKETSD